MRCAALLLAAAVAVAAAPGAGAQPPRVRFHHLHYRVGDPSAAMAVAVKRLDGVRVVVPGLGVGVRAGDEYLLFDRTGGAEPASGSDGGAAFAAAVNWLRTQGVAAHPEAGRGVAALATLPGETVHHVGFAAEDLAVVVAHLRGRGLSPLRESSGAALFDAGGVLVEIVRDTARPDAYWCPMHPDVRSPDRGPCPLCGMELTPIPPPKVGAYRLDVALDPAATNPRRFRFTVREPDSNAVVTRFATVHERRFHLFVISRDLEFFRHVHPVSTPDGTFLLEQEIPPGEYMLFADFLPEGGVPQLVQRAIILAGGQVPPDSPRGEMENRDLTPVRVTFEAGAARPGRELPMTFTVTDARTGSPVTDLEPYLGAPAHMMIVRADLTDAVHAHPEEQMTGGPTVTFHPLIPSAGEYKLWIQFQRRGRVITVPFRFRAEPH